MNSGLEMKFLVAAVHCGLDQNDKVIIDPNYVPNSNVSFSRTSKSSLNSNFKGNFTFVFDSLKQTVIGVNTDGKFTLQQYNEALSLCREGSQKIFDYYKDIVTKYATVL